MPDPDARALLNALVRERGLERFAYFLVTGEGRFFPNGVEATSGHVLDATGQVFRFWTSWDAERAQPSFKVWKLAPPNPRWERIGEYQRARGRGSRLTGNVPTSFAERDLQNRSRSQTRQTHATVPCHSHHPLKSRGKMSARPRSIRYPPAMIGP